jgi:hypothetical protein
VAQLKAYDALLVYTFYPTPSSLGDNLATYFESGGGVVLATYATQSTGAYGLSGRFETTYTLSTQTALSAFSIKQVTLGTIHEPASPLLKGVVTFGMGGNYPYHMPAAYFTKNGATIVARFSDGTPAIVRGVASGAAAGRNLVEINTNGQPSTYIASGWDATTDGGLVFRNALLFSIPPSVTTASTLSMGDQAVYAAGSAQALTYTNKSSTPQTLTGLKLSGAHLGDFVATPSSSLPATVPPGGTFVVNVVFQPSGAGLRAATLVATWQNYSQQSTTLLTGTGI